MSESIYIMSSTHISIVPYGSPDWRSSCRCGDREDAALSRLTSRLDEGPLVIQVDGRSVDIRPSEAIVASLVGPLLLWLRDLQARHAAGW